ARVGLPGNFGGITDQYRSPEFASVVGLVLHGASRASVGETSTVKKESHSSLLKGFGAWIRNFFE
ncbi:MAG: cell division protein FtsA, partial [Spirochaeta sp.]